MCVAADSNVLIQMQKERLDNDTQQEGDVIRFILERSYLALDIDGHCLQEACECVNGPFSDELRTWVIQLENDGKLRQLALQPNKQLERKIKAGGLPKKDWKWAKLSAHPCVTYLLTEDIDFYHPPDKSAKAARKEARKNNRTGDMLSLLRDHAGVEVISVRHVLDFFGG